MPARSAALAAATGLAVACGLALSVVLDRRRDRAQVLTSALLVAAGAGLWLAANTPYEGPVLVVLSREHGLTLGDLVALPPLALAGLLVAIALRQAG